MGHAAIDFRMSATEFLRWDESQTVKHEFVQGEVFAMTGVSDRHATTVLNLALTVRNHLKGSPCRVYATDVKLRVEAADAYFYPDLMVTCGEADRRSPLVKSEAKFIAEVLSPATAAYDRGDKFLAYRALPSLHEYLLIDSDRLRCDLYRKGADGLWVLHPAEPGQPLRLASLELEVSAADLFADLEDPAA
jgi:Uma2 family endonuclease